MANLDASYDVDNRTKAFELHEGGVLVCLAGPGTGKTYSLLARTAALTARSHPADSICYLTFIKEISRAFVDDYIQRFGEAALEGAPRITTLHSFACRLLRNQGFRIGYDGHLYFCNVTEAGGAGQTFLEDLLPWVSRDSCRTVPQLRDQFDKIKAAWRDGVDPGALPEPASSILGASLTLLRCYRLVDWDQTIPTAHSLLRAIDDLPEWIAKIRHYFVDEYQDFNVAEQAVIEFLANQAESLVVVGDDDQSLYSGRGGSPDGIRNLYADPQHDRVSLTKCYRCPATVVARTNTFQAAMGGAPRPMVASKAGGEVLSYRFKSSKAEVAFLSNYLQARMAELPAEPKSKDGIVCLFPSRRVLDGYFDMLSPSIPCARRKSAVFQTRSLLALVLQLLLRPGQRYLERLLLRQYGDLKPRHRKLIVDHIMERNISPSAACRTLVEDGSLTEAALTAANSFVALCTAVAEGDLAFVAQFLSTGLGTTVDDTIAQLKQLDDANDGDSDDLVATICDVLLPDTASQPEDPLAVLFLTMHGSKGLTKRTVVIPGLEEAHLPGEAAGTELAEKMRLFFVAMSRSTDRLLLTFPHNRGGNDSLNFEMVGRGAASRFIAQAGIATAYHE
jgi:superfamily I DNA/RNA helicase